MRKRQIFIHQAKSTWPKKQIALFGEENFNWNGNSGIMFIAESPSEGKAPGFALNFKKLLNKYGFGNCYVTNLCDVIGLRPNPRTYFRTKHFKVLRSKINAVKPQIIVAVGKVSEKILKDKRSGINIRIEKICHFSQNSKRRLKNNIKRVSRVYGNIKKVTSNI